MKRIFNSRIFRYLFSVIAFMSFTVMAVAQDASVSKSTTTQTVTNTSRSIQPWLADGVILLLILIVLFRRRGSSGTHTNKVTYTKTTSTEDN